MAIIAFQLRFRQSGKWKVESVNSEVESGKATFYVEFDVEREKVQTFFRSTFAFDKYDTAVVSMCFDLNRVIFLQIRAVYNGE